MPHINDRFPPGPFTMHGELTAVAIDYDGTFKKPSELTYKKLTYLSFAELKKSMPQGPPHLPGLTWEEYAAQWTPYQHPKTGEPGAKSANGRVVYGDMARKVLSAKAQTPTKPKAKIESAPEPEKKVSKKQATKKESLKSPETKSVSSTDTSKKGDTKMDTGSTVPTPSTPKQVRDQLTTLAKSGKHDSLDSLRQAMPSGMRGKEFDQAVLGVIRGEKVKVEPKVSTPKTRKPTVVKQPEVKQPEAKTLTTPKLNAGQMDKNILDSAKEISQQNIRLGGMVPIPQLVDSIRASNPSITEKEIHDHLKDMEKNDLITMQINSEPSLQKELSGRSIQLPRGLVSWVQVTPNAKPRASTPQITQSKPEPKPVEQPKMASNTNEDKVIDTAQKLLLYKGHIPFDVLKATSKIDQTDLEQAVKSLAISGKVQLFEVPKGEEYKYPSGVMQIDGKKYAGIVTKSVPERTSTPVEAKPTVSLGGNVNGRIPMPKAPEGFTYQKTDPNASGRIVKDQTGNVKTMTDEANGKRIVDKIGSQIASAIGGMKEIDLSVAYNEIKKQVPDLTVPEFHDAMMHLWSQRKIQLHVLNETHKAQDPGKGIFHNNLFYNYIIPKSPEGKSLS